MLNILPFLTSFLLFLVGCEKSNPQNQTPDNTVPDPTGVVVKSKLVEAFPGIRFERPVDFQGGKDGTDRIFVVEQQGVIYVMDKKSPSKNVFLDIKSAVDDRGNEEGLLGLAFHPDFKNNGYFYLNYTVSSSETIISRFKVSGDNPNKADTGSESILMRFNQPYDNHNGGQIAFGPDGYLYIAVGDGGSGGDPQGHGQNTGTLLGSILRIDVNTASNGLKYGIPTDNPFVNSTSARKEIYAYGMRNPWRMSFDSVTGKLWCGDVGQNKYEEVDIIEKGGNYGWNIMEGLHEYRSGDKSNLKAPVLEIAQSTGDKSITGGYVYRGKKAPSLTGKYVFADFVSGRIYALTLKDDGTASNSVVIDTDLNISSFGVDNANELYICAFDDKIYNLTD